MSELHGERNCTPWLHDLLDLIEKHMLLVPSPQKQRKSASYLLAELQRMDRRTSSKSYCTAREPQDRLSSWSKPEGFLSELNETAQRHVNDVNPRLDTYISDGRALHRSQMPDE